MAGSDTTLGDLTTVLVDRLWSGKEGEELTDSG